MKPDKLDKAIPVVTGKVMPPQPIPGLMCGPAEEVFKEETIVKNGVEQKVKRSIGWRNIWHHATRKGTYAAIQDPPGTITLTPITFKGETKVVHSMEELRKVDTED